MMTLERLALGSRAELCELESGYLSMDEFRSLTMH